MLYGSKVISPRARKHISRRPSGERRRLIEQYHRYRLSRNHNGMLAVEMESVLDGHFIHVQRFLDYYRDAQWSGWLGHITA